MSYKRHARYRSRRRFNPAKALVALLTLAIAAGLLYGGFQLLFGNNGLLNRSAAANPNPTASGSTGNNGTSSDGNADSQTTDPAATPVSTPTPTPTPRPTPEAMPPESTDPAVLNVSWEAPSVFNGVNAFPEAKRLLPESRENAGNAVPAGTLQSWLLKSGAPSEDPGPKVSFGTPDAYAAIDGVLTFRGNNYRDSAAAGKRSIVEKKLEIVWESPTGAVSSIGSYWPGTGWTGQPLLVHWSEETRNAMNLSETAKGKDLTEVIYPTLDGSIYFLDLETGEPTRNSIDVGFTFKGTPVVDPRGYPLLFVGQGLNENGGKYGEFQYRFFNLINQEQIYALPGRDSMAFRPWGAFDSSGLVDAAGDTLIQCGENGLVYKVKLNTEYDAATGRLSLAPQLTRYRYHVTGNDELGIESSPAAWKNFLYFTDNGGTLQCLDLNTMSPVWFDDVGDDSDCTTVIEETPEGVFLYTANEVDKRSNGGTVKNAPSQIRKYNAVTGERLWQVDVPCVYQYYINGGVLGTPLLGKDDISDLIIFNVALTGSNQSGKLIALSKKTGETVWERDLPAYSWSSPVDVKSDDGTTYGLLCGFDGYLRLFDPKTGKDLHKVSLGGNIESSPAVYNDMIVVGSYAKKLFGVRIR